MRAGMTTTEYDTTPFEEHHWPTGIRLVRPEGAPHGMPKNPWTLRAGPDADWAAELKITYVRPSLRARALGTVYRGQEDSVRFRGQFGQPNTLDQAVPVGPGGPLPWDAALVEVVATLFFIRQGAGGSRRGEPAYPDVLELNAAEPPAELRGTVVANKYGQAWS